MQFGERDLVSIFRSHANTNLPLLNQVHRVTFITGAEENRTRFGIEALEQLAQFTSGVCIEGLE